MTTKEIIEAAVEKGITIQFSPGAVQGEVFILLSKNFVQRGFKYFPKDLETNLVKEEIFNDKILQENINKLLEVTPNKRENTEIPHSKCDFKTESGLCMSDIPFCSRRVGDKNCSL